MGDTQPEFGLAAIKPHIVQFLESDRQIQYVRHYLESGSTKKTAAALGLSASTVFNSLSRSLRIAFRRGYNPAHESVRPAAPGQFVKGVSTLTDVRTGEDVLVWTKTSADRVALDEIAREIAEGLFSEHEPLPPIEQQSASETDDELAVFFLADLHIGMLADADETRGEDWDCKKSIETLTRTFDRVVAATKRPRQCVLVNLGDLTHIDDESNQTKRGKHQLDVDSRFHKVHRMASRLMRWCIDRLLTSYQSVEVKQVQGNHDWITADMMGVGLADAYAANDRVKIDCHPSGYLFHEFGQNFLGFTHGHLCPVAQLGNVMMQDHRDIVGRCKHNAWFHGHIHHEVKKDLGWYTVESFRSAAPNDAYHARAAYYNRRTMHSIILHREDGEQDRVSKRVRL